VDKREIVLATVGQALSLAEVDGSAGFFDLGGDSLTALRVITVLEERFAQQLDLVDLLTAETLDEYCRDLDSGQGIASETTGPHGGVAR
jgi:acyl carrier protein